METTLGKYIISQTRERGFYTKTLAKITGLSNPIICSYIHGRYNPTVATLILIAEGISILTGEDPYQIITDMVLCHPDVENMETRWEKRKKNHG